MNGVVQRSFLQLKIYSCGHFRAVAAEIHFTLYFPHGAGNIQLQPLFDARPEGRVADRPWVDVSTGPKVSLMSSSIAALVPRMREIALSLCGDDEEAADELVEKALESAARRIHEYDTTSSLDEWLKDILMQEAVKSGLAHISLIRPLN